MKRPIEELKALLMALMAPAVADPDPATLSDLSDGDWHAIDAMAFQHRLYPWLHMRAEHADPQWPMPDALRERWRRAYQAGVIGALTAKAAIVRLASGFADAGVPMVALKGAQLAFFDYPNEALRPMRDVDILVAPDDLPAALSVMGALGCVIPDDRDAAIARALREKHVDPIYFPAFDRHIELHHRIMEPQKPRGPFVPHIATEDILAEARTRMLSGQAVRYPSAQHMLAHQVVHAAYNHRFDCGPLALSDIAMLCRDSTIDWAEFTARAQEAGYESGAMLVLALVERYFGAIPGRDADATVPDDVMAWGENLILQDFETRDQVKLAVEAAQGGGMVSTMFERLSAGFSEPAPEGRLRWLGNRAIRTIAQASTSRARSEAQAGGDLARWLSDSDENGEKTDRPNR